jgi:hypothetical protein
MNDEYVCTIKKTAQRDKWLRPQYCRQCNRVLSGHKVTPSVLVVGCSIVFFHTHVARTSYMNEIILKTKKAEVIRFGLIHGGHKGVLQISEAEKNIPFPIRRVFVMSGVREGESRGAHGHKKFDQIIVPVRGSFVLGLDDGENRQEILLNDPTMGIRLKPKLWHTMHSFSPDAVNVVFCDQYYDEEDYLRDYDEFLAYIKANPD